MASSDADSVHHQPEEEEDPEEGSPRVEILVKEHLLNRVAQKLVTDLGREDPEKKYGIERLKALGATVFTGASNPEEAEKWMKLVEKCFRVMRCPEDRKVDLATFLLQGSAEDWWNLEEERCGTREFVWTEFKEKFNEKFCPQSFRDEKRAEFLYLVQGEKSVAEYEKKFAELAKYAMAIIADDGDKCRRFERGLREEIRTPVTAGAAWRDFSKLVEAALRVELSLKEGKGLRTSMEMSSKGKKRKSDDGGDDAMEKTSSYYRFPSTKQSDSRQDYGGTRCPICGKTHQGPCRSRPLVCYNCGELGHYQRECPQAIGRSKGKETSQSVHQPSKATESKESNVDKGKQKMEFRGRNS